MTFAIQSVLMPVPAGLPFSREVRSMLVHADPGFVWNWSSPKLWFICTLTGFSVRQVRFCSFCKACPGRETIQRRASGLPYDFNIEKIAKAEEVLAMFEQMHVLSIKPDEITYLVLFSACSHGGLVEQSQKYFRLLMIPASQEHYACTAGLLHRNGYLLQAFSFIKQHTKTEAGVWSTFLSFCRLHHGYEDLVRFAAEHILEQEPPLSSQEYRTRSWFAMLQIDLSLSLVKMQLYKGPTESLRFTELHSNLAPCTKVSRNGTYFYNIVREMSTEPVLSKHLSPRWALMYNR